MSKSVTTVMSGCIFAKFINGHHPSGGSSAKQMTAVLMPQPKGDIDTAMVTEE